MAHPGVIQSLTPADVDRVLQRFYGDVRADPLLGPVFASHVTDWDTHIAKIAAFWRNAIFKERGYSGNPMQVHMAAGNIEPHHFVRWLELLDATLVATLPADMAAAWSRLAHRIGRGLRSGILLQRNQNGPPILTD